MSHVALYRKYRPKNFSEVINQEHIKKTLKNALALNKVAHAYLFSGPRGVGKTTVGRLLAKAVNCSNLDQENGEFCGECGNCREIISERSIDIIEIDAASNRGIDEIRELREKIKYMPSKLKYRVFIIDEVHMLTIEAFNALLKTLEEPPGHIIFILATTEPQKVPTTILSRCQRFDFRKIGTEELEKHVLSIAAMEGISLNNKCAKIIAMNSDGSSRDALSLLGQIQSAFNKKNIEEDDVIELLGLASVNLIISLAILIFNKKTKEALDRVDNLIMQGYNPTLLNDGLIDLLRNLLLYKNSGNDKYLSLYHNHIDNLKFITDNLDNKNLVSFINYLIESKNIEKYSSIVQLPLELAIIKYIQPDDKSQNIYKNSSVDKNKIEKKTDKNIISCISSDKKKLNNNLSNNRINKNCGVNFDAINKIWEKFLESLMQENYSLGLTLRSSQPLKISGGELMIECDYSFHKDCIENPKNREIIENILSKKIGSSIKIKCIVKEKRKCEQTEDYNNRINNNEPQPNLVNTALDIMGGKIIK